METGEKTAEHRIGDSDGEWRGGRGREEGGGEVKGAGSVGDGEESEADEEQWLSSGSNTRRSVEPRAPQSFRGLPLSFTAHRGDTA
jgi:hypothetical protein